jgi:hypothetical protein
MAATCLYMALELIHTWNASTIRNSPLSRPVVHDAVDMITHAALQTCAMTLVAPALSRRRLALVFVARVLVEFLVFTYAFDDVFYGRRDEPTGESFSSALSPLGIAGVTVYVLCEEAVARAAQWGMDGVQTMFNTPMLGAYHYAYIMVASAYLSTKQSSLFYAAHTMNLVFPALVFAVRAPSTAASTDAAKKSR